MRWFGMPWPSPEEPAGVCSDPSMRVETPVGQICFVCGTPVTATDSGLVIPSARDLTGPADSVSWVEMPAHVECFLENVLGVGAADLLQPSQPQSPPESGWPSG